MIKYYIGIDPGKQGGIVCLDNENNISSYYFIPKIKNEIDVRQLSQIFFNYDKNNSMVFIEHVHALYGSSAGATFDFGYTCGMLEGIVSALGFSYIMVKSSEWQKEMFQGINPIYKPTLKKGKGKLETKKMAEIAHKRLYPYIDLYITENGNKSKNVHGGIVDALLISSYGLRKFFK
jgi:hypothetical protein